VTTEDDFFRAVGPATFAFDTSGTQIKAGARIGGNEVGVIGHCDETAGALDFVGVRGEGAAAPSPSSTNPATAPNTGVLGMGGMCHPGGNTDRVLHGAGVVGVAGARPTTGDSRRPIPPKVETGNVGVFGLGGDGERRASESGGVARSGPMVSGPGVLGHGGRYRNLLGGTVESAEVTGDGSGVVGISGLVAIPQLQTNEMLRAGVFGKGRQAGVRGQSPEGRGGVFGSESSAQVQLQPREEVTTAQTQVITPQQLRVGQNEDGTPDPPVDLPLSGQAGDLLVTTRRDSTDPTKTRSTLWFCTRGAIDEDNPALWREVLMGAEFPGVDPPE
jgi:hypothetical protein